MPMRGTTAALVALTCALVAGCSASHAEPPVPPPATSPASPTSATTTGATPSASPAPPTRADVVATGTRVRSGPATVRVLPAPGVTLSTDDDDDHSVLLTVTSDSPSSPGDPLAYVAGAGAEAFADGTALAGRGGLSPTGALLSAGTPGVLVLRARSTDHVTVWFAGTAVARTDWGVREGGRSLAVTPTSWARDGGNAAHALTWSQLVAREPDADSPTMRDQLECHELGARDKPTWNLEPWRPQVDGLAMIAARCNPT